MQIIEWRPSFIRIWNLGHLAARISSLCLWPRIFPAVKIISFGRTFDTCPLPTAPQPPHNRFSVKLQKNNKSPKNFRKNKCKCDFIIYFNILWRWDKIHCSTQGSHKTTWILLYGQRMARLLDNCIVYCVSNFSEGCCWQISVISPRCCNDGAIY